jgi:antitoxin (DNA-binding transcriptional repressor) of toxin-antitoxin stability system
MQFVSVRDLRGQPRKVWRKLHEHGDLVVTSSGRPIAVISPANEENLEESLAAIRRARAVQAVARLQRDALRSGTSRMGRRQINAQIGAARKERRG